MDICSPSRVETCFSTHSWDSILVEDEEIVRFAVMQQKNLLRYLLRVNLGHLG